MNRSGDIEPVLAGSFQLFHNVIEQIENGIKA
jgi:hypothetical protein